MLRVLVLDCIQDSGHNGHGFGSWGFLGLQMAGASGASDGVRVSALRIRTPTGPGHVTPCATMHYITAPAAVL